MALFPLIQLGHDPIQQHRSQRNQIVEIQETAANSHHPEACCHLLSYSMHNSWFNPLYSMNQSMHTINHVNPLKQCQSYPTNQCTLLSTTLNLALILAPTSLSPFASSSSTLSCESFLNRLQPIGHLYAPFNLIVGENGHFFYHSNQAMNQNAIIPLSKDKITALSNALLNTPWPKICHGKTRIKDILFPDPELLSQSCLQSKPSINPSVNNPSSMNARKPSIKCQSLLSNLLDVLRDKTKPSSMMAMAEVEHVDHMRTCYSSIFVPQTRIKVEGIGGEGEKEGIGVNGVKYYGTRSSVVILADYRSRMTFYESFYDSSTDQWTDQVFHFTIEPHTQ